jgi:hypothetical protein
MTKPLKTYRVWEIRHARLKEVAEDIIQARDEAHLNELLEDWEFHEHYEDKYNADYDYEWEEVDANGIAVKAPLDELREFPEPPPHKEVSHA